MADIDQEFEEILKRVEENSAELLKVADDKKLELYSLFK